MQSAKENGITTVWYIIKKKPETGPDSTPLDAYRWWRTASSENMLQSLHIIAVWVRR